ncbi:MAG: hypothetical protein M3Q95_13625, partial [Bacteroidota bacterium]|nr:hypothetical protein [Bacteroidota bacterium]
KPLMPVGLLSNLLRLVVTFTLVVFVISIPCLEVYFIFLPKSLIIIVNQSWFDKTVLNKSKLIIGRMV